jgi:hypothetical protein
MSDWTPEELNIIGGTEEIELTPADADGSPLTSVIMWAVTDGTSVFVRSVHGRRGRWWRQVNETGRGTLAAGGSVDDGGVVRDVRFETVGDIQNQAVSDAYNRKYAAQPDEYRQPMVEGEALEGTWRVVPV